MLSHLGLLSESCRPVDIHFLWHTTTITWSLPVLKNQDHSGKNTPNLSHCATGLWLLCRATPLWHADCVESLLYYSQPMRFYFEPLALCWTTCASYATCHLTKHTPPTRDFLSLFPSRVLSSIHLCDMTFKLNKVDVTCPNLVVCRFFLRLTFCISLSFSLSLYLFFPFFLGWRTPNFITELSGCWAPD